MKQAEYDERHRRINVEYERRCRHARLGGDTEQLADEWLERAVDRLDDVFMADGSTEDYDAREAMIRVDGEEGVDV